MEPNDYDLIPGPQNDASLRQIGSRVKPVSSSMYCIHWVGKNKQPVWGN